MDSFIDALLSEKTDKIPDGEYGSSLRMFNKTEKCYDVCYTCDHCMKRLRFTKEDDKLIGKVLDDVNSYWIFSDITDSSFVWKNVMISEDGTCILDCEIHGKRVK